MLRHFTLSSYLCSCPIQHVPAESARSAGEIRKLELFFTAYTLSIIARCWPEVYLVVPWRVRLIYHYLAFTGLQLVRSGALPIIYPKERIIYTPDRIFSRIHPKNEWFIHAWRDFFLLHPKERRILLLHYTLDQKLCNFYIYSLF